MQLTSIEQCKVRMTVFNPIWGEGKVREIDHNDPSVFIAFAKYHGWFYERILNPDPWRIDNLYTEPISLLTNTKIEQIVDMARALVDSENEFSIEDILGRTGVDTSYMWRKHIGWEEIISNLKSETK